MGDPLKKVMPGDRLKIPARTFNTFIDAARDFQERQRGQGRDAKGDAPRGGIVLIKNASGADVGRCAVLGVDGVLFSPDDNENEFAAGNAVLVGVTPAADHRANFVVTAAPIAADKIGPAYVFGVAPVKVNVQDEDHGFAEAAEGMTDGLKSAAIGSAAILWKKAGTGSQWALVRLGQAASGLFAVKVAKDGGSAGGPAEDCSFTYTVKDLAGVTLAEEQTPQRPRFPHTEYNPPADDSPGVAYYDENGDLQLLEAVEEVPKTDEVAVVTSVRYDTAGHKFQLKKTTVRVLEKADEDAAWTDIVALTECDDT